jgi:hypothetical protein
MSLLDRLEVDITDGTRFILIIFLTCRSQRHDVCIIVYLNSISCIIVHLGTIYCWTNIAEPTCWIPFYTMLADVVMLWPMFGQTFSPTSSNISFVRVMFFLRNVCSRCKWHTTWNYSKFVNFIFVVVTKLLIIISLKELKDLSHLVERKSSQIH